MFHMFLQDPGKAQEQADAAIAIASEYHIRFALAHASIMRAWALGVQGHLDRGLAEMRQAIVSAQDVGYARRPRWFPFLAELEARQRGSEEGLKTLSEGLILLGSSEERFYEAELHRVKGELLLMQSDYNTAQAASCFEHALAVAREQRAKSLELHANISLARRLRDTNRHGEARTMLAAFYDWFTEGFDTPI
jgi:predicted ATPase